MIGQLRVFPTLKNKKKKNRDSFSSNTINLGPEGENKRSSDLDLQGHSDFLAYYKIWNINNVSYFLFRDPEKSLQSLKKLLKII